MSILAINFFFSPAILSNLTFFQDFSEKHDSLS